MLLDTICMLPCTCSQVTTGSDVYSFGVLMWSLYTGQQPYVCDGDLLSPNKLFPKFPCAGMPQYVSLAEQCMQWNPHDRPSFGEISSALQAILPGLDPCGNGSGGAPAPAAGPGPPRPSPPTLRVEIEAAAPPSLAYAASAAQQPSSGDGATAADAQQLQLLTGGSIFEEGGIEMISIMSFCDSRCLLGSGLQSHLDTLRGAERHHCTTPGSDPSI